MAEPAPDVAVGWLVDKVQGPTSHDVVGTIRRQLARRTRVGHTGTLDPFATGLLVVLAGRATRLARYLSGADKTYRATVRLGETSLTGDPEGPLSPGGPVPDEGAIRAAVDAMEGPQTQATPAFSAVKVGGEPLYRKARRGEVVEGPRRDITIHEIKAEGYDAARHEIVLWMRVSGGTYVRQIAADLGERLGCGGYCAQLRRLAIGELSVEGAVPADVAPSTAPVPLTRLMAHLPSLDVDADDAERIGHGMALESPGPDGDIAVVSGGTLIAVGARENGTLRPQVVLYGAADTPAMRT